MADKLYVVVRADLSPGPQAVQACHAAREFAALHPEMERSWFERSNHLAILAVPDEQALVRLLARAEERGVAYAPFREPDYGDSLTAVAFEPGERGRRLCSGLRLAGSPVRSGDVGQAD